MNTKCKTCRIFAAFALILVISISVANTKYLVIPTGASTSCNGPDEVISGGGRCWMNRNLGAIQVATASDDSAAYGDLYQWGRRGEGHQNRTSPTTTVRSSYDVSWYRAFIKTSGSSYDWRDPHNNNLWQGLSGVNNPCPQGFRIPTKAEWEIEMASWGETTNAADAFASPLKLVVAGHRERTSGDLSGDDSHGYYWSSTVNGDDGAEYILLHFVTNTITAAARSLGMSVRCIKD